MDSGYRIQLKRWPATCDATRHNTQHATNNPFQKIANACKVIDEKRIIQHQQTGASSSMSNKNDHASRFTSYREALEHKTATACAFADDDTTATTANKVVVDIDEYYRRQKDHERNDREKKQEATDYLHNFQMVMKSSLNNIDRDNEHKITDENSQSNSSGFQSASEYEDEHECESSDEFMKQAESQRSSDIEFQPGASTMRILFKEDTASTDNLTIYQNQNGHNSNVNAGEKIDTLPGMVILFFLIYQYERHKQRSLTSLPLIYCQATDQNESLRSLLSAILLRDYKPTLFLGTRSMLNSTYGYMKCSSNSIPYRYRYREIVKMRRDGALIGLDWEIPSSLTESYRKTGNSKSDKSSDESSLAQKRIQEYLQKGLISQSIVLILHGVNTDTSFGYMRSIMKACADIDNCIVVGMNARGCGGVELETPRFSNAAYTNDLRNVVDVLTSRLDDSDVNANLFLVGFSLGANTVVKYLGESANHLPKKVAGGVSLCNPMRINHSHLASPWREILSFGAKKHYFQHRRSTNQMTCRHYQDGISPTKFTHRSDINKMTANMVPFMIRNSPQYPFENTIGYDSNVDYWNEASSQNYISRVPVPLLVCFASDDKIAYHNTVSSLNASLSNPNVMIIQTPCGGHIGWHSSLGGIHGHYGDRAAVKFIQAVMKRGCHWERMIVTNRTKIARDSRELLTGDNTMLSKL